MMHRLPAILKTSIKPTLYKNAPKAFFSTSFPRLHDTKPTKTGIANEKQVFLDWNNEKTSLYNHFWLRDHCRCDQCYHPITRQRLVDTFAIPRDIQPKTVESTDKGLSVTWPDGHESKFAWDWLHTHSYNPVLRTSEPLAPAKPVLWDSQLKLKPVEFEAVMNTDEGLREWLGQLETYGIGFVEGVPTTIEDTEKLARRISFLRETHYSTGFWSFTADLAHADTAYTQLALGAHTDNTYFTEPAGLQMFHKLEFKGQGGDSLFVDGFSVAQQLKEISPNAYRTLSTTRIPTHSAGDENVLIVPSPRAFPILNHGPDGELYQIRYNNDDRSTLDHLSSTQLDEFYDALFLWSDLLKSQKNELWDPLAPGRVVIFDNWRVLHGRSAFTGHRRICGAYFPWDDYKSRVRTLALTSQDKDRLL